MAYITYTDRILDDLNNLKVDESLVKKELAFKHWQHYDVCIEASFRVSLHKARKLTSKKFACNFGKITRIR